MEDLMYNTYEGNVAIYGDFDMPIPTYVFDKKIDFKVLLGIMLVSNSNPKEDDYRYIDDNRLNKKALCEECGISMKVLKSRMKYLQEKNIIIAKNTKRGLSYQINYSKDSRYYVSISHIKLKAIYDNLDRDAIKLFLLLVVQCKYLNNKRPLSNAFLCSKLGYSVKAKNNLSKISQLADDLVKHRLIKKSYHRTYTINENGKTVITRTDIFYKIVDY